MPKRKRSAPKQHAWAKKRAGDPRKYTEILAEEQKRYDLGDVLPSALGPVKSTASEPEAVIWPDH